MDHQELVKKSGLLRYVKEEDHKEALEQFDILERSYPKGKVVFGEDDVIDRICIVTHGSIRSEKTYPDGDVHIVSVFQEGEIFGLEVFMSQKKTAPVDFLANEVCRVLFLSVREDRPGPHMVALRRALAEQLADDNIRKAHKIEILAERGLRDRVMVYLDILARKSGSNEVTVPMSREQLSQYLCVNRSALSNALNQMKREGIIDFRGHTFRILKKSRYI